MNGQQSNELSNIFKTKHTLCLSASLVVLMVGCVGASSLQKEAQKKYSRPGESIIVPYSKEVVSNAIVSWSTELTNHYPLFDETKSRLVYNVFTNDPSTIFVLDNEVNRFAPWGEYACLPASKSSYWATVIIRIASIGGGNRVSVAIHGRHDVRGLVWNIHTLGFEREKSIDIPPCPQDERQVLNQILSKLRKRLKQ